MCRLFGFRSVTRGQIHRSLLMADNALAVQSEKHRDGWGIAYYCRGIAHVLKGITCAKKDQDFRRLGEFLRADTVIAHLRLATRGEISLVNCHPFQYGNWVMAHNGDLPQFEAVRPRLLEHVDKELLCHLFGTTDSEIYFMLFLTELMKHGQIDERNPNLDLCSAALRKVVELIRAVYTRSEISEQPILNTVISNGNFLLGYKNGRELCFSVHKSVCAQQETCEFKKPECFSGPLKKNDTVTHLMLSSEPFAKENVWQDLRDGQIIGLDHQFRLFIDQE